jgi:hypothetical protein
METNDEVDVMRRDPGMRHAGLEGVLGGTLEGAHRLRSEVEATELSAVASHWVERYERLGGRRPRFLWRWVTHGLRLTLLSCVDPGWVDHCVDTRFLQVLWDVVVDDFVDERRDAAALRYAEALVLGLDPAMGGEAERRYAAVRACWEGLVASLRRCPGYAKFADVCRFDHWQVVNACHYSLLVNQGSLPPDLAEHDTYTPANYAMVAQGTVDLACSSLFDPAELGVTRELFMHAQWMGRIGNLTTGWEREARVRDFTSGVFAKAVSDRILRPSDLQDLPVDELIEIVRGANIEAYFFDRWCAHRETALACASRIQSFDAVAYVRGFQDVMEVDLAVRGMK